MGCCKCNGDYSRWVEPQPPVWTDPADDKEYCFFHAPKNEKWVVTKGYKRRASDSEFNTVFFSLMQKHHGRGVDPLCLMPGIVFPGEVNFKKNLGEKPLFPLVLQQSEFFGKALFNDLIIELCAFDNVTFHAGVDFSRSKFIDPPSFYGARFCGRTHFVKSEFESGAIFIAAEFEAPVWFSETHFCTTALFHSIKADKRQVRMQNISKVSLSNVIFSSLEASMFSFTGCEAWPDNFGYESPTETKNKGLEELYRAMKQNAAEGHDQPQVSHWHFHEKLMAMKRGGDNLFDKIILPLYWATSGFGERAVRAGVWLLALLLLPFLANSTFAAWLSSLWAAMPWATPLSAAAGWVRNSVNATAAVGFIPFMKDVGGTDGWFKVGQALWQGVIVLQFTLFALAVRNRFRR